MSRKETLAELQAFQRDFKEYAELLRTLWKRGPGYGWYSQGTDDEIARVEALREDLSRQYGHLRPALAEPHGGIPMLGSNAAGIAGEIFHVALRDPSDNPWLSDAMDGSLQTIAIAVGHFERTQAEDVITRTSLAYWWRRFTGRAASLLRTVKASPAGTIYREVKDWLNIFTKLRPGP